MRLRIITVDGQSEIEQTALDRSHLLTDIELSRKHRVSVRRVQQIMKNARDSRYPRFDDLEIVK